MTEKENFNSTAVKGQTFAHFIMYNITFGLTIIHNNVDLEVYHIANASVISGFELCTLKNVLIKGGIAVLLFDYYIRVGGIDGAESTLVQVGNHQIPAKGQIFKGDAGAIVSSAMFTHFAFRFNALHCLDVMILSICTGIVCKFLNSSVIIIVIVIDPGNNTGIFV